MPKVQFVTLGETFEIRILDSYFTLSRIPADEINRMLRRHTKKRPGGNEEVDSLSFNREYRDRLIVGWREIDGDPPITIDNKMRIPNEVWEEIQKASGAANIDELRAREESLGN